MLSVEAESVLSVLIVLYILKGGFEYYIAQRQINVLENTSRVPNILKEHIHPHTFKDARIYALGKEKLECFRDLVIDVFLIPMELYFGVFIYIWEFSVDTANKFQEKSNFNIWIGYHLFIMGIGLLKYLKDVPFAMYDSFVFGKLHNFADRLFPREYRHALLINNGMVIYAMLQWHGVSVLQKLALSVLGSLIATKIYPSLIEPVLQKSRSVDNNELKLSIAVAGIFAGCSISDICMVEESARSSHDVVHLSGTMYSKRIFLSPSLLNGDFAINEVLALVAHEIAHWKFCSFLRVFYLTLLNFLLLQVIFDYCFGHTPFMEALGSKSTETNRLLNLIAIFIYVLPLYNCVYGYFKHMLNRHLECKADKHVDFLGYGRQLQSALIKINLATFCFPVNDWLHCFWYREFPPLLNRLRRLERVIKSSKKKQRRSGLQFFLNK